MTIYTVGFAKKTAAEFFGLLRRAGIKRLVDIRLRNTSALAGFTIARDLPFFLKELCDAEYIHELRLAPTDRLLDGSRDGSINWERFESEFNALLVQRKVETVIDRSMFAVPTVLLCSEPTPDHCHRRLVAEYLSAKWGSGTITHL
jgi:uncharacterized protein (DUF488 family)